MTNLKIDLGEKIVKKIRTREIELLDKKLKELKNGEITGLDSLVFPWSNEIILNEASQNSDYVYDPLYGCVVLEPKLVTLYNHPLVQRLNHIHQLSFAFGYPSASHTRLSHSLGVVYLMEEALTKMFRKNEIYSTKGKMTLDFPIEERSNLIETAKAVCLLHDIGHGPYSHTIDRYIGFLRGVDRYADKKFCYDYLRTYLKPLIKHVNLDYDSIEKILNQDIVDKGGPNQLIANILDSQADVDRMDYLVRDSHFSGIPIGTINAQTLIENMVPFQADDGALTLAFRETAIPAIKHFLFARDSMYINCYENPPKLAAERMIVKATDDFINTVAKNQDIYDRIKLLIDTQLLAIILTNSSPNDDCFKLAKSLICGEVFEEIYAIDISKYRDESIKKPYGVGNFYRENIMESKKDMYIKNIAELENKLAEKSDLNRSDYWKIAIYYPPPESMSPTGINISILRQNNNSFVVVEIGKDEKYEDIVNLIERIRNERLKIRVFVSASLSQENKEKIKQNAKRHFESIPS